MGGDALGPLRELGESQLQIQFTVANGYDSQAMGLLGLNAALAAIAIAGDELLGQLWWLALIGLLVCGLLAGSALFIRVESIGLNLTVNTTEVVEASRDEIERGILDALSEAIVENALVLEEKSDRVAVGTLSLIATITSAIVGVLAF
jgi:hypothetical protein